LAEAEQAAQEEDLDRLVTGSGGVTADTSRRSVVYTELTTVTSEVTRINDWDLSGRPE
jgi:hypothetical protein